MAVSRRTPRSWHVSQGFTSVKRNVKSGNSGLRLVHTLDTAGKAYYAQLWKMITHSWQRDYATGHCYRQRREQAIAQHGVLRERYRASKKNLTATLYDFTNAFACDPAYLGGGERKYKTLQHKNISASDLRLHSCDLIECVDDHFAAKIGSGTLPGDTVAGGWFLLHLHSKNLISTCDTRAPDQRDSAFCHSKRS